MKIKLQVIAALGLVFFLSIPLSAFAQEPGGGIDQFVNNFFGKVFGPFVSFIFYSVTVNGVSFPLIVAWLIFASIFLTVYMGFIQFTGVKHSIDLLRGSIQIPRTPVRYRTSKRWPRHCLERLDWAISPVSRWRSAWVGRVLPSG
jgi:hypothetical protein